MGIFLGILVILTMDGHFCHAEIRIPKAARKYKTKVGFQIDVRSLIGPNSNSTPHWRSELPNRHQFENDKRYRTGIWDCYLHTILVNIIMVDWVQYVRDLGTLLSMKISEKSRVMVSHPVDCPWTVLTVRSDA